MNPLTITSKGQVTIPVNFRHMFDMSGGDKVNFLNIDGRLVIEKAKKPTFEDLYNCLPKSKRSFTIEQMDEALGKALGKKYAK